MLKKIMLLVAVLTLTAGTIKPIVVHDSPIPNCLPCSSVN
jgi:hypothetical protein